MVGRSHVVCGKDKAWSPALPTCAAIVKCGFIMDNEATAVYVDGTQIPMRCPRSRYHGESQCTIDFLATAKVLAIEGYDREAGCEHGGLVLTCSSPKRGAPCKLHTHFTLKFTHTLAELDWKSLWDDCNLLNTHTRARAHCHKHIQYLHTLWHASTWIQNCDTVGVY